MNDELSGFSDLGCVNPLLIVGITSCFPLAVSNLEVLQIKSDGVTSDASQGDGNLLQSNGSKDYGDGGRFRMQLVSKGDSSNSSSVHPVRMCEDENLDYDSTSSFEFHKGERSLHQSVSRSLARPMSSKWNDAEKWIMNKQNVQSNVSKKANMQNQVNRQPATNMVRVVPESTTSENKPSVKRVDFCQSNAQAGSAKFAFASHGTGPHSGQVHGANALIDLCPESKDLMEVNDAGLPCTKSVTEETAGDC